MFVCGSCTGWLTEKMSDRCLCVLRCRKQGRKVIFLVFCTYYSYTKLCVMYNYLLLVL